jgi:hypothetical protein
MKSAPQSTHVRLLSWNSIGRHLVLLDHAGALLRFASDLLAAPLSGKRLLGPAPITRLEIEGMLLNILDDVFLLHLALEAAERTLDGLAFLDLDFSHALKHPLTRNRYSL